MRGALADGVLLCAGVALLTASCGVASEVVPHRFSVTTDGMAPTLRKGQVVTGRSVSHYRPHRGDIVVFTLPSWEGDGVGIKRVIAIGGDTVECCAPDGRLLLNGRALTEPYVRDRSQNSELWNSNSRVLWEPTGRRAVPAGSIWVAGDNRGGSVDSRLWGPIPASSVHYVVRR
jgi:signal peptidase I